MTTTHRLLGNHVINASAAVFYITHSGHLGGTQTAPMPITATRHEIGDGEGALSKQGNTAKISILRLIAPTLRPWWSA